MPDSEKRVQSISERKELVMLPKCLTAASGTSCSSQRALRISSAMENLAFIRSCTFDGSERVFSASSFQLLWLLSSFDQSFSSFPAAASSSPVRESSGDETGERTNISVSSPSFL